VYVSVIHRIADPEVFWGRVQATDIPAGIALHGALPNEEGTKATCLWEADSLETVRSLVEETVGEVSDNEYFAVAEERAQGLPG
jgi:hypothetical protein